MVPFLRPSMTALSPPLRTSATMRQSRRPCVVGVSRNADTLQLRRRPNRSWSICLVAGQLARSDAACRPVASERLGTLRHARECVGVVRRLAWAVPSGYGERSSGSGHSLASGAPGTKPVSQYKLVMSQGVQRVDIPASDRRSWQGAPTQTYREFAEEAQRRQGRRVPTGCARDF